MINPDIFTPGTSLKLVALSSSRSRLTGRIIGYKINKYLVIEWPKLGGAPARLDEGVQWTASLLNQGDIYGFQTQVLGASRSPVALVFLQFPDSVEKTSLRQDKRLPVNLPAVIFPVQDGEPGDDSLNGVVRDISEGGCQLVTTREFAVGDLCGMTIHVSDDAAIDNLEGEIKSCRALGPNFLIGLKFRFAGRQGVREDYRKLIDNLKATPLRL